MAPPFVIPIHRSSKNQVHVPIANDTESVEHFVLSGWSFGSGVKPGVKSTEIAEVHWYEKKEPLANVVV